MGKEKYSFTEADKARMNQKFVSDGSGVKVIQPLCHTCKHWNFDLTCKAFPKGIPQGILMNLVSHVHPVEGDGGIRYEEKDSPNST